MWIRTVALRCLGPCILATLALAPACPMSGPGSVSAAGAAVPAEGAGPVTTSFPGIALPRGITTGPDGALWFTDYGNDTIGRITTTGAVSEFSSPDIDGPIGITSGPDGALWFTNQANNTIGRITTSGAVTAYSSPAIHDPTDITAGPDGALWFTNQTSNMIGRITTSGSVTSFYVGAGNAEPHGITAGPDGALWFTDPGDDTIGRITTSGHVSLFHGTGIDRPSGITSGPDGALWFTNDPGVGNGSIGRVTTSGAVTDFTSAGLYDPHDIVSRSRRGALVHGQRRPGWVLHGRTHHHLRGHKWLQLHAAEPRRLHVDLARHRIGPRREALVHIDRQRKQRHRTRHHDGNLPHVSRWHQQSRGHRGRSRRGVVVHQL